MLTEEQKKANLAAGRPANYDPSLGSASSLGGSTSTGPSQGFGSRDAAFKANGVTDTDMALRERRGSAMALDKLQNPYAVDVQGAKNLAWGMAANPFADRTAAPVTVGDFGAQGAQNMSLDSRNAQAGALDLQRQAALGLAPSVAALQMRQGMDQGTRAQFALANSARGGAGAQALAQRQAQSGLATTAANTAMQGGILRAGEMAQARDAFGNLAGAQRAGDLGLLESARGFGLGEAGIQSGLSLGNLNAGLSTDQLNLQRQQAALAGLTGADQLGLDAYYRPVEDQLGVYGNRVNNRPQRNPLAGQIIGGLFNAGGAIGAGAAGKL